MARLVLEWTQEQGKGQVLVGLETGGQTSQLGVALVASGAQPGPAPGPTPPLCLPTVLPSAPERGREDPQHQHPGSGPPVKVTGQWLQLLRKSGEGVRGGLSSP